MMKRICKSAKARSIKLKLRTVKDGRWVVVQNKENKQDKHLSHITTLWLAVDNKRKEMTFT